MEKTADYFLYRHMAVHRIDCRRVLGLQSDGMPLDAKIRHICFARYLYAFQNPLELTVCRKSPRNLSDAAEVAVLDTKRTRYGSAAGLPWTKRTQCMDATGWLWNR